MYNEKEIEIKFLEETLSKLRVIRDRNSDLEIRKILNSACDKVDVLISKLNEKRNLKK